jgi:MFS family permease
MVFSLLPIFFVYELNGSEIFGFFEGTIVVASYVAKMSAGFLMDFFKKKKPMLMVGAALTVVGKTCLACAWSPLLVFISNSFDRFAKGLRHAATDSILADMATKGGYAYSLRYMMTVLGAFIGSIITSLLVRSFGLNFHLIFTLAIIPTVAAIYILKKVKYKELKQTTPQNNHRWNLRDARLLPREYWSFIVAIPFLMMNRFSEGFITLLAKEILPDSVAKFPIFIAFYELCAMVMALVTGKIADKINNKILLVYGIFIVIAGDIIGIFANNFYCVIAVYLLAGMHMGATQGLLASIVAQSAPKPLVGTAFAIYYGIDGISLFCSNCLAGESFKLAEFMGIHSTAGPFIMGAVSSTIATIYLLYSQRQLELNSVTLNNS